MRRSFASTTPSLHPRFATTLKVLLFMILTLMALGAGVRTMNAGLSCPDWPLCFGKVIPDFHPAVWFEFVHRAYAGVVALVFGGSLIYAFAAKQMPRGVKTYAVIGLVFLLLQIVMGALTVLKSIGPLYVTSHLMLATLFFCSVLAMLIKVAPNFQESSAEAPREIKLATGLLVVAVFAQILIGGFVASTYAGSVCVDWPLCNGKWVPTWQGAIGLQIIHRFTAYFLAIVIPAFVYLLHTKKNEPWMTKQLLSVSRMNVAIVLLQVCIGIANLLLYIPPSVTVIHQSMAILLLAVNIRTLAMVRSLGRTREASGIVKEPVRHQELAGVSG